MIEPAAAAAVAPEATEGGPPLNRVSQRAPRLGELDALRGLGAMAVSLQHVLVLTGAGAALLQLAALTPLNALIDGTRAVLLFFVLSGFVLALPFCRGPVSPLGFVVKRIMRLYPAYWVALAVSIAVFSLSADPRLSPYAVMNYASLLTEYDAQTYNVVFWSLVQEMRLSILFPLIMLIVLRLRAPWLIGISVLLVAIGYVGEEQPGGPIIGLAATAFYAFFFVLGAVTAKHLDTLTAFVQRTPRLQLALLLGLAVCIYGAFPVFGVSVPVDKAVIGLASAGLIALAIGWAELARVLRARPFQFLGAVSYSYYLLHVPVSDLATRLTGGPGLLAAGITVVASLVIAWLTFRWIERPSIVLGHRLYGLIARRTLAPVGSAGVVGA